MAPAGYGNRVEGLHAVTAAARAGRVERLWVEERRMSRAEIAAVAEIVGHDRVRVVRDVRPNAVTEVPQGLVADCRPISPVALEALAGDRAAILALDHVEDPQNVGAAARSAHASGVTGMVVSARRAAPLGAAAFKAAAGALETLPVAVVGSIPEALSRLKASGLWVVGLDSQREESLFGLGLLTEPVVAVIGAEGRGLSELTRKRADLIVSIPMVGDSESLNASVTAALVGFEIMRVRSEAARPPV